MSTSIAQLQALIEHAPTAIAILDRHWRYRLANLRWLSDYGLPADVTGRSHYELLSVPERWKAMYQRALAGAIESCEDLLIRGDRTDWVRWQAQPWQDDCGESGLMIHSEIISDRKQLELKLAAYDVLALGASDAALELAKSKAELQSELAEAQQTIAALRDRNAMLQLVLDTLPQTIFWKDRNSVYLGCNLSFAQDAGVASPDRIVGKTDYDLAWSKAEGETFRQFDRRVMERDRAELHVIEPPSVPNQQQGWVETSKIPLHDQHKAVIGILGTYQDITHRAKEEDALRQSEARLRQQAEQLEQMLSELQQAQTQLVQSEKMSSLGQLVAGVAHEINNPVNFIYGNLAYAQQYIEEIMALLHLYQTEHPQPSAQIQARMAEIDLAFLQEDVLKLLRSMRLGADRICEIIKSLRNFSRLDESEIKAVNLHEGLDSTLMILQSRLRGTTCPIEVVKHYGSLPLVECYAGQLNQVFMNILSNAIDAFDDRHVSQSIPARITIATFVQGDCATIRIADNGTGMSEAVQCRLFDPFFTTKPIGKGTGLGMSISYQIITEKHSGSLRCQSRLGEGTEFSIEIPVRMVDRVLIA